MKKLILVAFFALVSLAANADCVVSADLWTKYSVENSNTIIFYSGSTPRAVVKVFYPLHSGVSIRFLKNDFCSFDSHVLMIDGEVVDVNQVTNIR